MQLSTLQSVITLEAATLAVKAATEKSAELGLKINVAVTDNGGHLLAFMRMPGAFLHSIDISIDKAYTAISFGFPTSEWDGILPPGSTLREGIQTRDRLVSFGGGIPIMLEGQCIGGIGVSGGSEEEDAICAQAGIQAIGL